MKIKIFVASILTLFLSGQLGLNGSSQELKTPYENISSDSLIVLKAITKIQKKIIKNNEDTICRLRKSFLFRKHNRNKVEPVLQRVYVTVPIYVPIKDSLAYHKTFSDTLTGDYIIDTVRQVHRSFFYRLFHHTKNQN